MTTSLVMVCIGAIIASLVTGKARSLGEAIAQGIGAVLVTLTAVALGMAVFGVRP